MRWILEAIAGFLQPRECSNCVRLKEHIAGLERVIEVEQSARQAVFAERMRYQKKWMSCREDLERTRAELTDLRGAAPTLYCCIPKPE